MWSLIYSIVNGSTLQPYVVGRVQGLILKGGHVKISPLVFGGMKLGVGQQMIFFEMDAKLIHKILNA